jgi:toxin ParE1/3/4
MDTAILPHALRLPPRTIARLSEIRRHPSLGSPRYAHELDLPTLRHRAMPRYPYLVFYAEARHVLEVWRALHVHPDIPTWLQTEE